jgi:hypothetical protein
MALDQRAPSMTHPFGLFRFKPPIFGGAITGLKTESDR